MDKPNPNKATPPIISAQRPKRVPINRPASMPPVDMTNVAAPIASAMTRIFTSRKARDTPTAMASMLVPSAVASNTRSEPLCSKAGFSGERENAWRIIRPDDQVIGISHDNHVAHGLTVSPSLGPEIKHVVQVNVGKEW
jgi:hypothetical protein